MIKEDRRNRAQIFALSGGLWLLVVVAVPGVGGVVMKRVLFLSLTIVFPGIAASQTGTIIGTVNDARTGRPLPGANVLLVDVLRGAASQSDGHFEIRAVPHGVYTARVSFVGYKTHEESIAVGADTLRFDVGLEPDFARHDEVVVTSIATERARADADVAVGRIDAEGFYENNDYADVSELAVGKVPGLTIQPASGNVAGEARMIMRTLTSLSGEGRPIVYVDGVRIDAGNAYGWLVGGQEVPLISQLNPRDIKRIDVLKGPAGAALYGTSASNGVVLITTARGAFGSPVTADYRFAVGQNRQAKEYTAFTASTPEAANAIFRNGGFAEHTLELRGGSETVRFFTSYDSRNEDGHTRNNAQDRQSFRANVEALTSRLRLNAKAFFLLNDVVRPINDHLDWLFGGDGYLANVTLLPTPYSFADSAAIENRTDVQQHMRFIGSLDASYRPLRGLTIHAGAGYDGTEVRDENYSSAGFRLSIFENGHRFSMNTATNQKTYSMDGRIDYTITSSLQGATTVGFQAFERDQSGFNVTRFDFPSNLVTSLQSATAYAGSDSFDEHRRELGLFASQELTYRDQLFVTLGLRRDFASVVGYDAPSILYPRASFALRLDNLVRLPHLNFLKVRAAYGEAGQLPESLDGIPLVWSVTSSPVGPAAIVSGIGNPEIQPERIGEFELGLDASALDNRLSFEGTYYHQNARNAILPFYNPPSSGLTASPVPRNVGSARGWGVETSLSGTPVHSRDYSLDLTLLWQWQDNEVTSLGGAPEIGGANVVIEGLPNRAYYGWTSRATFDSFGRYLGPELTSGDNDGDGRPDRVFIGVPYPKQNGSLLLSFRFLGDFRLTALADWQLGQKLLNEDNLTRASFNTNARRSIALVQIGRVEDPCLVNLCDNDGALRPDFDDYDVSAQEAGTSVYREAAQIVASTEYSVGGVPTWGNFVEDADFIKLREVSILYDFTEVIRGSGFGRFVRTASVALAARNLFTGTSFSGVDPEASTFGGYATTRRSELTLPHPRIIYATFSLGF